ncbi:glycosyltransferase [Simkania negevensis]|uniref:Glycosyltransferase n=1 Tax=Simkania negevensis TaxID=83561 RepID=A0ABS3ARL3_9BACT|nr:glycosyltransferase [Simkania negevensis]
MSIREKSVEEEWSTLADELSFKRSKNPSRISVIIPTHNSNSLLSYTLYSLTKQNYSNLEIIIVNASSDDPTIPMASIHAPEIVRTYTVAEYNRFEMVNRGISSSTGEYINILYPGDVHIFPYLLHYIASIIQTNENPSLVYAGSMLQVGNTPHALLHREITKKLLRNGHQPSILQSCWFRKDVFRLIGKFDASFQLRAGYEWLCRFYNHGGLEAVRGKRIAIDYYTPSITQRQIIQHFLETWRVIKRHFGVKSALVWLIKQKDTTRLIQKWLLKIKTALLGR